MSLVLQVLVIVLCILFLVYVIRLVAKGSLLLKYSLLWIVLTIVILICAIFPQIIFFLANCLGFLTPSNLVFLIGLFFLLALVLSLSTLATKQAGYITNLVQDIALLEKRLAKLEAENVDKKRGV